MTAAIELDGVRVVHNAHRPDEVHTLAGST